MSKVLELISGEVTPVIAPGPISALRWESLSKAKADLSQNVIISVSRIRADSRAQALDVKKLLIIMYFLPVSLER